MMRYVFFTLLGFFGPALIMLFLRLLWFRLRQRMQQGTQVEIIDITPHKNKPSKLFIGTWLAISIACTALLLWQMDSKPASQDIYRPAHINAQGQFIPAQRELLPQREQ